MKYSLSQYWQEATNRIGFYERRLRTRYACLRTPSERRIAGYHNAFRGKRAFILGMGPSLTLDDIELIRSEVTFACNKIYLVFDQTTWRPSFYFVVDILVARQNAERIRALDLNAFICSPLKPALGHMQNALYYPIGRSHCSPEGDPAPCFSHNLLHGTGTGGFTVIYDQLQWAFWMGFSEVVLLGVDFQFQLGHLTGEVCKQQAVLESRGETNHFHPDYRKPGEKWTYPRLEYQYRAFRLAAETFALHGRTLWNASRTTALDCVPRIGLEEVLKRPVPPSVEQ